MNRIIEQIIEQRNGHYCHCLEVEDIYELEAIYEALVNEFTNEFTNEEIQEFIDTLTIYCLNDKNEDEVYDYKFNINN